MPTIITFILIIASFTIASKYELKSIIKQPLKINSSSPHKLEAPIQQPENDIDTQMIETDSTSQSKEETQLLLEHKPMISFPKEVNIILISHL